LYKETLEREDKITMAHSIELRPPYLDPEVVEVATSIATKTKLPPGDVMGKHVHREAALGLGVPSELAFRVKQAAQHGSGVHKLVEEIALKNGYNKDMVESMGYSAKRSVPEVLGSSARYGYLYSTDGIWDIPDHVQLYLDTIAYEGRLTSEDDQATLATLLKKAQGV
ncbi:MAG: hypothetical protein HY619_02690, partial [Thaumarchaeota archaeon]|nr:hypothetical protein [Nitrososphaerota archaeon]